MTKPRPTTAAAVLRSSRSGSASCSCSPRPAARTTRTPTRPSRKLAEDHRREKAEQQRRQERQRVANRAEELARLGGAGRLDCSVPSQAGDEAARQRLDENRDYHAPKADARLARDLADQ
ncbi:hypothetical protein GKQ77_05305 [Streptomyces sp. BG9H]|uniref:Uncharacterized protein n=1 Tax=Streptomyces anatolicus TaxID=2675858 RepID=A0ABS6YHV5_9ACTN|nr:hypothetical protein [Streptomyces anatolicus]MBW5420988.1 hypothetical protein [Streptomyces anatolicus]